MECRLQELQAGRRAKRATDASASQVGIEKRTNQPSSTQGGANKLTAICSWPFVLLSKVPATSRCKSDPLTPPAASNVSLVAIAF